MRFFSEHFFLSLLRVLSNRDIQKLDILIHRKLFLKSDFLSRTEHVLYWDDQLYIWGNHPAPIRPSTNTIDLYRNFLTEEFKQDNYNTKKNILILGSTPELRDLVAEVKNTSIYIADISFKCPLPCCGLRRMLILCVRIGYGVIGSSSPSGTFF